MSLGLTTGYNSLNGLGLITGTTSGYGCGMYGGYGGYYASDEYVENAKKSMENGYDISTTRQSFTGKQSTETMTFTEHCQTIQYMLQEGRSDDALFEFNNMVDEMEELGQYSGYTEQQIKTLAQNQYRNATGSTLLGDISKYADSSFEKKKKNAIPGVNFFTQTNSKEDLISEVTGTKKSDYATASKVGGALVGGVGTAAAGYGIFKLAKSSLGSTGSGFISKALTKVGLSGGKVGLIALAGVGIGALCLGVKSLFNKSSN